VVVITVGAIIYLTREGMQRGSRTD